MRLTSKLSAKPKATVKNLGDDYHLIPINVILIKIVDLKKKHDGYDAYDPLYSPVEATEPKSISP